MLGVLRLVMRAAVLASALFAVGALANTPQSSKTPVKEKSADYFPLKKGMSWKYVNQYRGKAEARYTQTVTKEETGKDGTNVTVELHTPLPNGVDAVGDEIYHIAPNQVLCVKSGYYGQLDLDASPLPLIQYPLVPGKKWEWSGKMNKYGKFAPAKVTFEVIGPAEVKTPAGTFKAIKVHSLMSATDPNPHPDPRFPSTLDITTDYWFVSGVGMVRRENHIPVPGLDFRAETILLSYKTK